MLKLNFVTRVFSRSSCKKSGDRLIFNKYTNIPKETNVYLFNTYCKTYANSGPQNFISPNCRGMGNFLSRRIISTEAAVKENSQNRTYFQQIMLDRKKQAQRSVLMEIAKKEDIPYALGLCYKFGNIAKVYSYSGESNNYFLLLEFHDEVHAQNLLLSCQCRNINDVFPIFSRLVQFEKKKFSVPNGDFEVIEESVQVSSLKKGASISDLIEDVYLTQKLSELNTRLRYFFCTLIRDAISGLFPYCDVLPFGSSVNGIGRHGCDLDAMIRLYPEQVKVDGELFFLSKTCIGDVRALQQRTIFCLGDFIRTFFPGVSSVQKIIHARMPILKLRHRILSMECDVSINNMSAVLMSEIIHFCGETDSRVRPLLYAVKKWAKDSDITYSSPGTYITNFGLTNLVLFFLQTRPTPILPAFNDALVILGDDTSPEFRLQYLKPIEEFKMQASLNEESLATLLKDFLQFLGTYPFQTGIISLMSGKMVPRNDGGVLWIQYPFEEDLNITKNVSDYEFWDMTEKARVSSKFLENNLNQKSGNIKDLGTILGIPSLKRLESNKPKKIDVGSLLEEQGKNSKGKVKRRIT